MKNWCDQFLTKSIFFITPDVKRGMGLECILPDFHIICTYKDSLVSILRKQGANIYCLEEEGKITSKYLNNSGKLLEEEKVQKYIGNHTKDKANILVFKPSLKTEILCRQKGYLSLFNDFSLNDRFEDKVKFYQLCQKFIPRYLIEGCCLNFKDADFAQISRKFSLPFIVQFSHGWAGNTTYLIKKQSEFDDLKVKFPQTRVKINRFIEGFTVLNNACIYKDQVFQSDAALQISNIPALCRREGVTCGREWPIRFITKEQNKIIIRITHEIGSYMMGEGYKGYFGLDFIIERKSGKVYLSENNARFTASSPFYTKLELGVEKIPLMVYHLAAFLECDIGDQSDNTKTIRGSQIIFREENFLPQINSASNFAVLETNIRGQYKWVGSEYLPQKLKNNEFIYMKREYETKSDNYPELARIETKNEVMENTENLKDWVFKLTGK